MTDKQISGYKIALKQAREDYKKAQEEWESLELQQDLISDRMTKLQRTITALCAMCSEDPEFDDLGITDAVIEVIESENSELTTADVVFCLRNIGFDIHSQKNIAASVHAILSRLAEQGKIEKVKKENATQGKAIKGKPKKVVVWRGPKYDPDALLL